MNNMVDGALPRLGLHPDIRSIAFLLDHRSVRGIADAPPIADMAPKTGASLSCRPLSFVLISRRSSIPTHDAVWSCRKIQPQLQKDAFIARRKGAYLAQQDDPHLIKKQRTTLAASCHSIDHVT
ncbi:hypothetical protein [Burkholderia lata]|uniref:hypothetical protein n=1 Tax=Burkholderia lata (strain ATCC 17760 / DSM 23089 / LMG 22485 / NCIMB 9086 / R18194 / 383) TaxID=482957 RepID=UPI0015832E8E|nr:hypothetical protein [Burkholderia lata]